MISASEQLSLRDRQGEDARDPRTWKAWPAEWHERSSSQRLSEAAISDECTTVGNEVVPVALASIFKNLEATGVLKEEALGFAIMAGNFDLVEELVNKLPYNYVFRTYPLHLATSYLNGYRTCCLTIDTLLNERPQLALQKNYLGHSTLDNLILTVIKSHTSLSPNLVDSAFAKDGRYSGQEIDICGRWDVESDCYRQLLESGMSSIPLEWKHKFCHTSVQVICYSFSSLLRNDFTPLFQHPNLFVLRCENCDEAMRLSWLHLPVLLAISLAEFGRKDEDLFGVIAIFLVIWHHFHPCSRSLR